jgi:FkbM family methyltransferase
VIQFNIIILNIYFKFLLILIYKFYYYLILNMENIIRFGTNYGGFYYPKNLPKLNENSVIYCIGAGEDITHDVILSSKLNCNIHIFDPTPRAIEHVQYVKDVFDGKRQPINNKRFGGADPNYWNILLSNRVDSDKLILHQYGVYFEDNMLPFYFPKNKEHVSCSLTNLGRSNDFINVPVKTLNTIMNELNHDHIDLLKIDVENIECDLINKMLNDEIYPIYLSVDFDLIKHNHKYCLNTISRLIKNGYSIIRQKGQDISFIRNI